MRSILEMIYMWEMNNSAKPSASVIAAGVVAILGGLFYLLTSIFVLMGMRLASQQDPTVLPPIVRSWMIGFTGFLICLAIFGVATGVGLLLLRNWARISALIWAGFSVFFGL